MKQTKPKFDINYYDKNKYVMHCDTAEKANIFCKYLHKLGRKWFGGQSYASNSYWNAFKEDTCYDFWDNTFEKLSADTVLTILEFDDFDWDMPVKNDNLIEDDIALVASIGYYSEEKDKPILHKEICDTLNDIYKKKNNDYGDSFAKLRNELPEAILVRIYDKYSRLKTLTQGTKQQVSDESVNDTLMDLANYCIMELVERKLEKEKEENNA